MKCVHLAMPTYDYHCTEMMQAAYRHCVPDDGSYMVTASPRRGCSLLANAFNEEWISCLNRTDVTFDYFFMLHGDVQPMNDSFIHLMVDELEKHQYNVLHAVVAIKDNRGSTSTGIGPIAEKWSATRKINVAELPRLPETFGVQDCLEKLEWPEPNPLSRELRDPDSLCMLGNTGCMLVKIDEWCHEFPGFVIEDRVVVERDGVVYPPQKVAGKYSDHYKLIKPAKKDRKLSNNVPEDWGMSRWCAREGLRVGCTKRVVAHHWGMSRFPANSQWGDEKRDNWFFGNRIQPEVVNIGK